MTPGGFHWIKDAPWSISRLCLGKYRINDPSHVKENKTCGPWTSHFLHLPPLRFLLYFPAATETFHSAWCVCVFEWRKEISHFLLGFKQNVCGGWVAIADAKQWSSLGLRGWRSLIIEQRHKTRVWLPGRTDVGSVVQSADQTVASTSAHHGDQ